MYAPLPARYRFLEGRDDLPAVLEQALAFHGLREVAGAGDNPVILDMAREVGLSADYRHDETPWCGLGLAVAVKRAGYDLPDSPLWALSWREWGKPVSQAALGDILVFRRVGGGHVGIYVGEDDDAYHVLGFNQSDACNITRFGRSTWTRGSSFGVVAIRRSPWRIAQPASVQAVHIGASGPIGSKVV